MLLGRFQRRLISTASFGVAAMCLFGAGVLTISPHRATTISPTAKPTPGAVAAMPVAALPPSARASMATPAVLGAIATPTPRTPAIPSSAKPEAAPIAVVTPAALPKTVTLTLIEPDGTTAFSVRLLDGADACSVLEEAKAEGKLTELSIDYSYLKTSLKSAYVRSINSFANNWTVKVNNVSPEGCSFAKPGNNDNVTWRYQ